MSAVYDNWERLVRATLRREDLRRSGLRTPSDISLTSSSSPSLSASSSFNFFTPSDDQLSSLYFSKLPSLGISFAYHQILQATDYLSNSNLIYYGLSGNFFSGVLEGGIQVAVKKVDLSSAEKVSFLKSEMEFFAKVSHPKLVPLLGHCLENRNHKFLVYKYMQNKDLFTSFYEKTDSPDGPSTPLDWKKRLKVATGVAQALCHLHHECVPPLVHRNVEARSILIDENYDGHLGRTNAVCAEKKDRKQSVISKLLRLPKGSEQAVSDASNATCSYDVYCFGKVLLALVTGIPNFSNDYNSSAPNLMENILPYITTNDKELFVNVLDPCLTMDEHLLNEIWAVAIVAKACLNPKPSKRPAMKIVLEALEDSKLKEFSTNCEPPSSSQFTQVDPAQAEIKVPEGSEVAGISEATTNAPSANRWNALWNSQYLPASGIDDEAYRNDENWDVPSPSLRVFSFGQLKAATENFSSRCLLGEGGFGQVFKGRLPEKSASNSDRQSLIAVKRWKPDSFQGHSEWLTEISLLGRLSHPNLIKLHGYCYEEKELMLVYEYMPKGSLNNHLFGRGSVIQPLSWEIRLKVLIGAARALAFLHAFKRQGIFRDFKTSSILLDTSYNAKLSDFGLAKMGPPENETHVSTRVMGTYGYAAPEYVATGHLYVKSDVFGFGVAMVEVLTGLRALDQNRPTEKHNLIDWIKPRLSGQGRVKSIMDSRLEGKYPSEAAVKMAGLALTCLSSVPKDRPSMKQVVETLENIERSWSTQRIYALR